MEWILQSKEAKKFRQQKLLEIKQKIRNNTVSPEEISIIKTWRRMFKDGAF